MDTNYIKEFVTLAECMSFSEASNIMFISQSSLSKHIQSLEKELGVTLFERTTRNISLSNFGQAFLPYAQRIAILSDEARISIDDMRSRSARSLTIATMQNPQYYNLAKYMISFSEAHPDISFQMVEADEFGLYDMFQKRQVNIFPTYEKFFGKEDYDFMPIVESHINVVFRADHPQAGSESIELTDLASERLLLPSRGTTLHRLIVNAFTENGIDPDIVYEGSSVGCIDLVRAGMGVSLHAEGFTNTIADNPEISCARIDPPITFKYGLGYRSIDELSRAERIYLSHMKKFELKDR